jgi:hypothetical protein
MEQEIRWPKKGDSLFPRNAFDPHSPTWVNLEWLAGWVSDDSLYALAFKEAGDKIIKELSRGEDLRHPDMFFMPIAYLYRHSLELSMKQIIRLGIGLEFVEENESVRSALKNHDLNKLWCYVRRVAKEGSTKDELDAVGRVIQALHVIDKSGQSLRYSKNSSGKKTIKDYPQFVRLEELQKVVEGVFNFLQAGDSYLSDALQMING